jgi:bifunctional non-homologous end joining protein LigD
MKRPPLQVPIAVCVGSIRLKGYAAVVASSTFKVTKPDKVLFPEGITKGELVSYYEQVAPWMLPHVRGRPISMQRFPDGIAADGWYEKNLRSYFPDWIRRVTVPKRGGTVTHALAEDARTLAYLANQGVITPHVWLSRADDLGKPDLVVIDLDPSEDDFGAVRAAALGLAELVREIGLVPYAQVTGSRGIHVAIPIRRGPDFQAVFAWAKALAERARERDPSLTTAFHKEDREDKIYVDVQRNRWAQTIVPPYAVRPRAGAPVATPVEWEEVAGDALRPDGWTLRTVLGRLREHGDPWAGMRRHARALREVA